MAKINAFVAFFQRIEKRRRDRINLCLAELRRLVPAAFEKQGSQKLEKAEILQLTVEHLKFLHSTGMHLYTSNRDLFRKITISRRSNYT